MARFGMDGYVRPPYRLRHAARMRALVLILIVLFAALVLFAIGYFWNNVQNAPAPDPELWSLRIVSEETPLKQDVSVFTAPLANVYLTRDAVKDGEPVRFDTRAYDALCAMLSAAKEGGYNPIVTRGYLDLDKERALFKEEQRRLRAQGQSAAEAYLAASQTLGTPGSSEYSLGLSVEICASAVGTTSGFESNPLYDWLSKNAWRYGFVLRYPQDKTDVTGHEYDPCCYRYVGASQAKRMRKKNYCLEEYVAEVQAQLLEYEKKQAKKAN